MIHVPHQVLITWRRANDASNAPSQDIFILNILLGLWRISPFLGNFIDKFDLETLKDNNWLEKANLKITID